VDLHVAGPDGLDPHGCLQAAHVVTKHHGIALGQSGTGDISNTLIDSNVISGNGAGAPTVFGAGISINGGGGQRPELHKAAIDAAITAGVKYIAYTSYVNADRFTDSVIAGDHRRTERYLEESGVAWTMLRNQIYANGLPDQAVQIVRDGKLVTSTPDARVAYVTREDCAAAAAAVLVTPAGHENKAYNITGPDAIGARELVALASEISGKKVELVVLDEPGYRKYLLDNGTPEDAINGALSFAAELNSPYLREPSTAVADLTGRPATSVRALLLASKKRLIAAAK